MSIIETEPDRETEQRNVTFTWLLQEISPTLIENVVLSVSHDGDRKRYSATLRQEMVETRQAGFTCRAFGLFSGAHIVWEPVGRFNQKSLERFADRALSVLRLAAEDEKVAALFTPSNRSCGCKEVHHEPGCPVYRAEAEALNAGRGR